MLWTRRFESLSGDRFCRPTGTGTAELLVHAHQSSQRHRVGFEGGHVVLLQRTHSNCSGIQFLLVKVRLQDRRRLWVPEEAPAFVSIFVAFYETEKKTPHYYACLMSHANVCVCVCSSSRQRGAVRWCQSPAAAQGQMEFTLLGAAPGQLERSRGRGRNNWSPRLENKCRKTNKKNKKTVCSHHNS